MDRRAIANRNPKKIEKQRRKLLGRKRPEHSKRMIGENNSNWKGRTLPKICPICNKEFKPNRGEDKYCKKCWGSKTPVHKKLRESDVYRKWRIKVFERDNYRCQICQKVGGYLEAHHIRPIRNYPELVLNIDNGITVCVECHKLIDKYR